MPDYNNVERTYPTDGRERRELAKKVGHVSRKNMLAVEDNFDDCGTCLT